MDLLGQANGDYPTGVPCETNTLDHSGEIDFDNGSAEFTSFGTESQEDTTMMGTCFQVISMSVQPFLFHGTRVHLMPSWWMVAALSGRARAPGLQSSAVEFALTGGMTHRLPGPVTLWKRAVNPLGNSKTVPGLVLHQTMNLFALDRLPKTYFINSR